MKLTWTLLTLVSLFAGVYIIISTIKDYLEHDVLTQTKRIQPAQSILPAVIFCAFNDVNASNIFQEAAYNNWKYESIMDGESFQAFPDFGCTGCIKFNNASKLFLAKDPFWDVLSFKALKDFGSISVFIIDNYINILSFSDLVTNIEFKNQASIYFQVSKRVEKTLAQPYSPCRSMSDQGYRQINCIAECRNNHFLRKYNCTLINYYSTPGYAYCNKRLRYSYEFDGECKQQCPEECFLIKFETRVMSLDDWDFGGHSIEISYSDLSYIEISQTPKMTGFTLISSIGGALGLFIGIRFLSLVELFEYFADIFLILFS